MNVLYITGSCLRRNTSANMSHNAFIQGLLENGCTVDIVMSKDSWGEKDKGLPTWSSATYTVFPSISFSDRIRFLLRNNASEKDDSKNGDGSISIELQRSRTMRQKIYATGKNLFYALFKPDPIYPLEKLWLKKASRFHSKKWYDIVISNSSPAASHRLVIELIRKNAIRFDRWIQIWEDPWYFDLYGGHGERIRQEEAALL